MGTVCVAIVTEYEDRIEIPVFVLSCRIFGYGVESAMLEEISKQCGVGERRKMLVGRFRANTQNHPCRNMYSEHGFTLVGDVFQWAGIPALPHVSWAQVTVST
jgi:predicted enzyme involved in methoxymalonyl-ACP biosynthesis